MSDRATLPKWRLAGLLAVAALGLVLIVSRSDRARRPVEPAAPNEPNEPSAQSVSVDVPVDDPPHVAETTVPVRGAPVAAPAPDFAEDELMRLLRSARGNDPKLVVELAREGNRRFPDSAGTPERASLLVHALAEQGLASEARGAAEDVVNRLPDSAWVQEIERFTGAHRHRNLRVNADGRLEAVDPPG